MSEWRERPWFWPLAIGGPLAVVAWATVIMEQGQ